MNLLVLAFCNLIFLASCGEAISDKKVEESSTAQTQTDTCDNPDADINCSFVNMPTVLNHIMTIADEDEPGEKLVISGTIFKPDAKATYPDVILYAYHTDSKGLYSKSGMETGAQRWHGHLHGWCKTDQNGNYKIHTIRPAPYPDNSMPAHIHMAIKKPHGETPYYVSDFVFKDDSLANDHYLKSTISLIGGSGVVDMTKSSDGTWLGLRDIVLTK